MPDHRPLEDQDHDRFILGIYNYCDRWCERCKFNSRCAIYHLEQQRSAEELLKRAVAGSLEGVLSETHFHCTAEQRAEGEDEFYRADFIGEDVAEEDDWSEVEDEMAGDTNPVGESVRDSIEGRRLFSSSHPLKVRAAGLMDGIEAYLDRITSDTREAIRRGAIELPDGRPIFDPADEDIFAAMRAYGDSFDVLHFYRYFIVVKLMRALGSLREAERKRSDLAVFARGDALCTAKLLDECLIKIEDALWQLGEMNREWLDDAMALGVESRAVRLEMEEVFTGWESAIRPGFDTEEERE